MFKRVLVLVVFLFGVFWWLTSRDAEAPETPTEVITVETENSEDGEGEATEESEATETTETEVPTETETEATPAETVETEVEVEAPTPAPVTNTNVGVTPAPVVTPAPTTSTPAPVVTAPVTVAPAPTTPSVPDRTTDIKVYVYESGLDLSDKTIPAGTINFKVVNNGRFTHDFNVSGFGNLGKVMPSETKTFTLKLGVGEYEAFSERRLDYERGVREDFTVVE